MLWSSVSISSRAASSGARSRSGTRGVGSARRSRRKDEDTPPPPDDPGNPTVNFHGESRRNDTHQTTTDPDAMIARKGPGKEAKLSYAGHVLLDNRHGLVANVCVTAATGTAEREAAVLLLAEAATATTVGG